MAVEDGQMTKMDQEDLRQLVQQRRETFARMMESLPEKGYELVV